MESSVRAGRLGASIPMRMREHPLKDAEWSRTTKLGPGSSRRVFSSLWLFVAALFCCSLGVSVVLGRFWAFTHGDSALVGMNGLVAWNRCPR